LVAIIVVVVVVVVLKRWYQSDLYQHDVHTVFMKITPLCQYLHVEYFAPGKDHFIFVRPC